MLKITRDQSRIIMKKYLYLAAIAFLVNISLTYYIPRAWGQFPIVYCNSELMQTVDICKNTNIWLGNITMVYGVFSIYIMTMLYGVVLAIVMTRFVNHGERVSRRVVNVIVAVVLYMGLMILFEIYWFRPWVMLTSPNGLTYTRYELNAMYGTVFALLPLGLITAGFGFTFLIAKLRSRRKNIILPHPAP